MHTHYTYTQNTYAYTHTHTHSGWSQGSGGLCSAALSLSLLQKREAVVCNNAGHVHLVIDENAQALLQPSHQHVTVTVTVMLMGGLKPTVWEAYDQRLQMATNMQGSCATTMRAAQRSICPFLGKEPMARFLQFCAVTEGRCSTV